MTFQELRVLTSEVLLKLEGDQRISDIIADAIVDVFEEHGIEPDEEGFDALMDVASNITLYSTL